MDDRPEIPDAERGLYAKYRAYELLYEDPPGNPPTGQQEVTDPFFLLKFKDPHARRALLVYALSCEEQYPLLARDLRQKLSEVMERPLYPGDELDAHLMDERARVIAKAELFAQGSPAEGSGEKQDG
jgi:hypothetical protein